MMCDMPAVFGQEQRKARKEHKCCECGVIVKPGEHYTYSHGVWDGSGQSFKQCLDCAEVSSAAAASVDDPEDGPAFTGLREWFMGYSCREFNGDELVKSFASDLNVDENKIRKVLRMGSANVQDNPA
ncbi:hypothetical protein ACJ0PQ_01920 [Citrobacter cronae]|uniref:hypothetical protein n=2 Tax=Enterobacterales TaxID=91347 RepID=UPI003884C343